MSKETTAKKAKRLSAAQMSAAMELAKDARLGAQIVGRVAAPIAPSYMVEDRPVSGKGGRLECVDAESDIWTLRPATQRRNLATGEVMPSRQHGDPRRGGEAYACPILNDAGKPTGRIVFLYAHDTENKSSKVWEPLLLDSNPEDLIAMWEGDAEHLRAMRQAVAAVPVAAR